LQARLIQMIPACSDQIFGEFRCAPPSTSMKSYAPVAIIAGVLFIALAGGTSLFLWKERTAQTKTASIKNGKPGAEPPQVRGPFNARVKIEEFGDFQCPSCAALSPALSQSEQKYHGRLCVIFRQFPLASHPHAQEAARAAEAAGLQGRFWEMHDLLYGSQLVWTRAADTRELFNQFAKSLGIDVERFKIDLESEQVKRRIDADQQRAASLGVNSTPAIFINGRRLPDSSLNQKALQEAIDAAANPKAR
jgi:protein-disulfide isomerase